MFTGFGYGILVFDPWLWSGGLRGQLRELGALWGPHLRGGFPAPRAAHRGLPLPALRPPEAPATFFRGPRGLGWGKASSGGTSGDGCSKHQTPRVSQVLVFFVCCFSSFDIFVCLFVRLFVLSFFIYLFLSLFLSFFPSFFLSFFLSFCVSLAQCSALTCEHPHFFLVINANTSRSRASIGEVGRPVLKLDHGVVLVLRVMFDPHFFRSTSQSFGFFVLEAQHIKLAI